MKKILITKAFVKKVNDIKASWILAIRPQYGDCGGMLETLNILPTIQDFRARMPEKGDCQATDGESIPGPQHFENVNAECLEFPASWNRNRIADELPESNVLAANYITDNHPLS